MQKYFGEWKSEFIRIASNERIAVCAIINCKNNFVAKYFNVLKRRYYLGVNGRRIATTTNYLL